MSCYTAKTENSWRNTLDQIKKMTLPNFLEYSQKSDETVWQFNKANKRKLSAVANDNMVSP